MIINKSINSFGKLETLTSALIPLVLITLANDCSADNILPNP